MILALAAVLMIVYFIFPFLDGIILGTVFAYVGRPIRDKFGSHRRLGSLVAAICIVVPIFLILGLGTLELANQITILARNQEAMRSGLGILMQQTAIDLPSWMRDLLTAGLENAAGLITSYCLINPSHSNWKSGFFRNNELPHLDPYLLLCADGWQGVYGVDNISASG